MASIGSRTYQQRARTNQKGRWPSGKMVSGARWGRGVRPTSTRPCNSISTDSRADSLKEIGRSSGSPGWRPVGRGAREAGSPAVGEAVGLRVWVAPPRRAVRSIGMRRLPHSRLARHPLRRRRDTARPALLGPAGAARAPVRLQRRRCADDGEVGRSAEAPGVVAAVPFWVPPRYRGGEDQREESESGEGEEEGEAGAQGGEAQHDAADEDVVAEPVWHQAGEKPAMHLGRGIGS
eukprot:scaffold12543_cov115-Isochrysis_galbana.AAC.8